MLKKYIHNIEKGKALKQVFYYKPNKWNNLTEEHKTLVHEFENKNISRKDIIELFKQAYKVNNDLIKPFLLTMIWGFGNTGYGNYRTNIYLNDMENRNHINYALEFLKKHEIENAFNSLYRIKGLGISFISKILYFASRANNIEEYPLIFDIRVANSLIKIQVQPEIFQLVKINPSTKVKDYMNYNKIIHQYAKELKLEAEDIELFLFNFSKNNYQN